MNALVEVGSAGYQLPHKPGAAGSRSKLYFHHMLGTAGSTFAQTLAASGPGFQMCHYTRGTAGSCDIGDGAPLKRHGRILYTGHNLFRLLEEHEVDDQYFTILRHPYDRLITEYFHRYLKRNPSGNRSAAMDGFLKFVDASDHLEFYIHHLGDLDYRSPSYFQLDEFSRVPNERAKEMAVQNLNERFWGIAIAEMLEESLFLVGHGAGLRWLAPWWRHRAPRTPVRPTFFDLPLAICRQIEAKTANDMQLWESCRAWLESRLAEQDFGAELVRYKNDASAP